MSVTNLVRLRTKKTGRRGEEEPQRRETARKSAKSLKPNADRPTFPIGRSRSILEKGGGVPEVREVEPRQKELRTECREDDLPRYFQFGDPSLQVKIKKKNKEDEESRERMI